MLKIRLQRVGRKHEPVFRIVVTESSRGPKSGNFIEVLGNHDPRQKDKTQIKEDRVKYWISKGAQLSGTVHNLLITKGVIKGEKINVLPKKRPQVSEEDKKGEEEKKDEKVADVKEEKDEKEVEEKESEIKEDKEEGEKTVEEKPEKEVSGEKEDKKEEEKETKTEEESK